MKRVLTIAGIGLVCVLIIELFLRLFYGFCDTVLIQEDVRYEYIAKPNQDRFRFRNHIKYNSESMRSDEVDSAAYIILGFGDSVVNGGVLTDHDSLATTILSDSLSRWQGRKVQFLNISAGSWGPDNCFAYLEKHGDFGAKAIYLIISSHDAYDNMNFEKIVDRDPGFPSKQYPLALYELVDRYVLPRVLSFINRSENGHEMNGLGISEDVEVFNTGFEDFLSFTNAEDIPFTIYLHASRDEFESGKYSDHGEDIIEFARKNNVELLISLEQDWELSDYRDIIHINAKGQKKLARDIAGHIKSNSAVDN